jgi:hypothetical protein
MSSRNQSYTVLCFGDPLLGFVGYGGIFRYIQWKEGGTSGLCPLIEGLEAGLELLLVLSEQV